MAPPAVPAVSGPEPGRSGAPTQQHAGAGGGADRRPGGRGQRPRGDSSAASLLGSQGGPRISHRGGSSCRAERNVRFSSQGSYSEKNEASSATCRSVQRAIPQTLAGLIVAFVAVRVRVLVRAHVHDLPAGPAAPVVPALRPRVLLDVPAAVAEPPAVLPVLPDFVPAAGRVGIAQVLTAIQRQGVLTNRHRDRTFRRIHRSLTVQQSTPRPIRVSSLIRATTTMIERIVNRRHDGDQQVLLARHVTPLCRRLLHSQVLVLPALSVGINRQLDLPLLTRVAA